MLLIVLFNFQPSVRARRQISSNERHIVVNFKIY